MSWIQAEDQVGEGEQTSLPASFTQPVRRRQQHRSIELHCSIQAEAGVVHLHYALVFHSSRPSDGCRDMDHTILRETLL